MFVTDVVFDFFFLVRSRVNYVSWLRNLKMCAVVSLIKNSLDFLLDSMDLL